MVLVFATHPVQYQVPLWRSLVASLGSDRVLVVYLTQFGQEGSRFDCEFDMDVTWDSDLDSGFVKRWVRTGSKNVDGRLTSAVSFFELIQLFVSMRPKFVLINGWNHIGYWQVALLAKLYPKCQLMLRAEARESRCKNKLLKQKLLSFFLRGVDHFFYIGNESKKFYLNRSINSKSMSFAPYSVDPDVFYSKVLTPAHKVRTDLEIGAIGGVSNEFRFRILFVGKLIDKKRPLDVIKGAARFSLRNNIKVVVTFIGEGYLKSKMQEIVRGKEDLTDNYVRQSLHDKLEIKLIGFVNQTQLTGCYNAADVLVLPSDERETWGLVVNEAYQCGTGAIVSDRVGCASDLVRPVSPDFVFRFGDPDALEASLAAFLKAPARAEVLKNLTDKYSMATACATILEQLRVRQ